MNTANPTSGARRHAYSICNLQRRPGKPKSEPKSTEPLRDVRGRIRSPATCPGFRAGEPSPSRGKKFDPHAFSQADVQALLAGSEPTSKYAGKHCYDGAVRLRAFIVVLYRTGIRIQEALDLHVRDLNEPDRQITIRRGKGGKRRVVAMDDWGWTQIQPWLRHRATLPPEGPLFCAVLKGSLGRAWDPAAADHTLKAAAERAGLERRVHCHAFRHAWAVEAWREGLDLLTIQRQLGHSRLDTTLIYLVSLGADELLVPVTKRKPPTVPMTA